MKWSYRLGRLAGIDVYIHLTFLVLVGWVGLASYLSAERQGESGVSAAASGVGFILALFGVVVLHELGHAMAARRYGIATRDITLLPIGGVARLERMPEDPKQELVVALAGPAVNVVLAALFFGVILAGDGLAALRDSEQVVGFGGSFLAQMLWVNVVLALFNMLPAFPMDGGRVLRALLAMRLDYGRATGIAATVGQGMAVLFGLAGLLVLGNPFLVFVAVFVWIGAAQEAGMVRSRRAMRGIPIHGVMATRFDSLDPDEPLGVAVDRMLGGFQADFPVVRDGELVGLLTREDLKFGLSDGGTDAPVGDYMRVNFPTADDRELLTDAMLRLQEGKGCRTIPVLRYGELVGLVTDDALADVLMIREALRNASEGMRGEGG